MTSIGYATLEVLPSLRGMERNLERGMIGPSARVGKKSGEHMGKVFARGYLGPLKGVGTAALGLLAVDKVAGVIKDSIAEARDAQKVSAVTAQVIKSTGGAANISAKQVGNLSTAISNKTGIDDEAIQSGANLLLTFKNIRNESGKGNRIFDQTTSIMTDMSTAMGTDAKSSAIQLGKALNDPTKGLTALTRVGVTFDAQQTKQIKSLTASGHRLQAQKIILKELRSEFGGTAKASTTAGEKAAVAWKNLEEQIGTALLPVLDKAERKLTSKVIPEVSHFIHQMQTGKGTGGAVAHDLEEIYKAGLKVVHVGGEVAKAFDSLPGGLKKAIAVGGVAAFAASKIPGVGAVTKGVGGAAVRGALGKGGVVPVFVTNEGFGGIGGGKGGKVPPVVGGTGGAGEWKALFGRALKSSPAFLTTGDVGAEVKGPGDKWFDKNDDIGKAIVKWKKLDFALKALSKNHPGAALKAYQDEFHKSGLSAGLFAKQVPKATHALDSFKHHIAVVKGEKLAHDFTTGASKAILLSQALHKTGISTSEYHKKLNSLPRQVATKVTTPGAVTSRKQAIALGHQYGLTPKQIKTLVQLAGVNKAVSDAARTRSALAGIPAVKHVDIRVATHNAAAFKTVEHQATGGTVWGPGTGTSDSVPIMASRGEEVINARQATKHRALLKAINAGANGYAAGGTVGGGGGLPSAMTLTVAGPVTLAVGDREFDAYFEESFDAQMQLNHPGVVRRSRQ